MGLDVSLGVTMSGSTGPREDDEGRVPGTASVLLALLAALCPCLASSSPAGTTVKLSQELRALSYDSGILHTVVRQQH